MIYTVSEIAALLGLEFRGDGSRRLSRVSSWESADDTALVFLERERKADPIAAGLRAGCVLAPPDFVPVAGNAILSGNPKLDFARAAALLTAPEPASGRRHPSAAISPEAVVAGDVDLGPFVVIGARARIFGGCILHAGVVIGDDCVLGEQCTLHPNVVLYPGSILGDRVVLHAGVVVGGDGFGYVFDGRTQIKFPQVGGIIIEDDVEIGSNTTLDRGSLGVTRIAAGAKIDNLVQIAHNVQIGRGVVIAAQTGISGSTVIEDYAVIGGQVGFGDHAHVQKGVVIGSKAGVLPGKIVRAGEVYWGVPVRPLREYKRLNALFGRLPELKADIDSLKEAVAKLEKALLENE
ncbi:MAG: UDP-3-O-(3-hydroxymyristoyl)glucosamine N-acyltransferase [Acidobacteriia bacterium]|nr:UDP-3-O-(3-hydroxymyristoyl)glucosamine N-acyltransferase [Terriglobia bacterium]